MDTPSSQAEQKKIGPIISTLIIVLILIMAALYIFASQVTQQTLPTDDSTDASSTTVQPITNNSDDVQSMQNDLNASTQGLNSQNF